MFLLSESDFTRFLPSKLRWETYYLKKKRKGGSDAEWGLLAKCCPDFLWFNLFLKFEKEDYLYD